jgi:hypothetical protein
MMKAFCIAVLASSSVLATGCSESTSPVELPYGLIAASVAAIPFQGELDSEYSSANNTLVFSSTINQAVGVFRRISINIQDRSGIALFSLGETSPHSVTYTESTGGVERTWTSAAAGASGNIRIVTLNGNNATGQFAGTLVPVASTGATGNKVITSGAFEIVF